MCYNKTRNKQTPGGGTGRASSPASAAAQRKDVIDYDETDRQDHYPTHAAEEKQCSAAAPPRRSRNGLLAWLETIVTAAIGVCSIVGLTAFLILCF